VDATTNNVPFTVDALCVGMTLCVVVVAEKRRNVRVWFVFRRD
jgi:hypothetical protein